MNATETLLSDEDVPQPTMQAGPIFAPVGRPVTAGWSVPQQADLPPAYLAPSVPTAPMIPTDALSILTRLGRIMTEYRWMLKSPPTPDMWYPDAQSALEDARRCARQLVASLEAMQ